MTQPNPNDPASASSENSTPDAVSPSVEARPDPPVLQRPAFPAIQPLEAPLIPVPGSIRPPPPGAPRLSPKPSAAPPPRLRPVAPMGAPNNIGPLSDAISQAPSLTDAEVSATQEIADALSNSQRTGGDVIQGSADSIPAGAAAPMAKTHSRASCNDPLFIRRTIIPILLTCGVILAGSGVLLLFGGEDNALSDLFPAWTPFMFFLLAFIFLGFGALNVLAVKNAKSS